MSRIRHEQLAARVQQSALAPDRCRYLLGNRDRQRARPAPRNPGLVDPLQRDDSLPDAIEIGANESGRNLVTDRFFDLQRRHTLKRAIDFEGRDIAIQHREAQLVGAHHDADRHERRHQPSQPDFRHPELVRFFLLAPLGLLMRHLRSPRPLCLRQNSFRGFASTALRNRCQPRAQPLARDCGSSCLARY